MSLVDKTLSDLPDHNLGCVFEIRQLNVFSRSDLSLLLNLLTVLNIPDFVGVDKRIILSDLFDQIRYNSFHVLGLNLQEALGDVEELLFDLKILGHF